jgi:hypothetical protein
MPQRHQEQRLDKKPLAVHAGSIRPECSEVGNVARWRGARK